MQQKMTVKFEDGTSYDIVTNIGDMVALEEQYDIAVSDLKVRQKMTWMVFMAWHAAKRSGKTSQKLDDWSANLSELIMHGDDTDDGAGGEGND